MSRSIESTHPAAARSPERIGDRFNRRLAEDRLSEAFASSGAAEPLSIGLIEIESDPTTLGVGVLGQLVGQRISSQLPPGARLVWSTATRFVVALKGEPLLEALMSIDRVRDALEREQWCVGDEQVSLAFGAGVATRRGRDEPIAETLAAAERSLAHSRRLVVKRHAEADADDASDEAHAPASPPSLDLASFAPGDRSLPSPGN